LIAFRL